MDEARSHRANSSAAGASAHHHVWQDWARPLRVHLSFVIVALLVAICAPLMWLTYHQGASAALAAAEQQMRLLSQQTTELYSSTFRDGAAVITMASVLPSLLAEPPSNLEAKKGFMIRALRSSPHLDGVYIGYPSGAFVQVVSVARNARWRDAVSAPAPTQYAMRTIIRASDGGATSIWQFLAEDGSVLGQQVSTDVAYDPRRRPWYRAAIGHADPVALGPYVSASTQSLTYTVAIPMERNRAIVIGADVLLETISHLLAEQAVSPHATGYVFDGDGKLTVHSDPVVMNAIVESYAGKAVTDVPAATGDPLIDAIRGLLPKTTQADDRMVRFRAAGDDYLARLSSAGFSGLLKGNTVVIAAPLRDFTAPTLAVLKKTLLLAAVLVLAGVLAALLIARAISRALTELALDARQIGDLDFAGRHTQHSFISEINMLSQALTSARDAIRTFALYVPRELVRRIVASGQAEAGQGVRQDVTILFSDIRDFTTISERLSPEEVIDLLTVYFQRMHEIVEGHNGVIVQFLGDSIYAMWNAPTPDPHHVTDACRCALALEAAIAVLNTENVEQGKPELFTRFGIHTGIAVVGSIGAEARRTYTAMGDTVNVASRLEGMNKQFGTSVLVSGSVRSLCGPGFTFRSLGSAHAKGRAEGIDVYELTAATAATAASQTTG